MSRQDIQQRCSVLTTLFILLIVSKVSFCEAPRYLPEGELPDDMRLKLLKDLNGYFPFRPSATSSEWEKRANSVRRQTLVALGLWPAPTRTPLNAVVHGKIEKEDYTVERVYFESMPGFFVTGSLYRPKGIQGKKPAVLCPHGHWANGRFYDAGETRAKQQIEKGAEKFHEAARSPLQARCVHLARMGCVVFFYDMIGYADSGQISYQLAHRFAVQRPEMNHAKNWGLFSPQAEANLQSVMGLQTWNSIRSIDFLESLPDVDPKRIGVTGASGGGTQTMILAAVDPRPAVSMPAVMVSTAMQGGCTCENCSLLRVGTGNIEFAALFAPKPQGLTAADDWTKELSTKGFPELKQHYELLGAPDKIMMVDRTEFKHNYNSISRTAMYRLFSQHFDLQLSDDALQEREFERLTTEEATVWNDDHPKPEGGDDFERELLRWWTNDTKQQLAKLKPKDKKSLRAYREVVASAVDSIIGRRLPKAETVEYEQLKKVDRGDYLQMGGVLRHTDPSWAEGVGDEEIPPHEEIPIVFLYPKQWEGTAVIWLDEQGKSGLFQKDGSPKPDVMRLINSGASVVGVDLFQQGEFLKDGVAFEKTRRVKNKREAAAYTFGYNHSVFARRVHDALSAITFVRSHAYTPKQVYLVGLTGSSGAWAACARAQAGSAIDRAAVNTGGFRFQKITEIHSPDFLPGGAKYGDLTAIVSLSAPDQSWVAGEKGKAIMAMYRTASAADAVKVYEGKPSETDSSAVDWLLAN